MTLVGFRRATIQILDADLTPVPNKKYVIEGVANEGATSAFEINGLSPEPVKVYGSDITYYVSQKGAGDLNATFSALDLPPEVEMELLGIQKTESGVYHLTDSTEAPYCAVLFESSDLRGEKIGTGIYAGKFGRDKISSETKTGDKNEPEADEYTFAPISKKVGDQMVPVGWAFSSTEFEALEKELFGEEAPVK